MNIAVLDSAKWNDVYGTYYYYAIEDGRSSDSEQKKTSILDTTIFVLGTYVGHIRVYV